MSVIPFPSKGVAISKHGCICRAHYKGRVLLRIMTVRVIEKDNGERMLSYFG